MALITNIQSFKSKRRRPRELFMARHNTEIAVYRQDTELTNCRPFESFAVMSGVRILDSFALEVRNHEVSVEII